MKTLQRVDSRNTAAIIKKELEPVAWLLGWHPGTSCQIDQAGWREMAAPPGA